MSAVILTGLAEDAERCRPIAHAFFAKDLDFVWLSGGPQISAARLARCVILVWTEASSRDTRFLDFAQRMQRQEKAIGALLDPVTLPDEVAHAASFELFDFRGDENDVRLLELLDNARAKARGIAPAPPQSIFGRLRRRAWVWYTLILAPALLVIGNLADVVSVTGWFNGPSAAERQALAKTDKSSCEGLRKFRDAFPSGYYADRVTRAIDHPQHVMAPAQSRQIYPQVIAVARIDGIPAATREAAIEDAMRRARLAAQRACAPAANLDNGQLTRIGVKRREETVQYQDLRAGKVAGFTADVQCEMLATVQKPVDRCSFAP